MPTLSLLPSVRVDLQAGGSLRLHTDLAFRSDHAALSVQFWVRGLSAQFDGSRCDAPGAARRYVRPARPSGWHCPGAVCLALWRSWGGQPAVQMVPLCSLAQVDRDGWHKVSVPASAFASSFGEAFDEVTNRRLELKKVRPHTSLGNRHPTSRGHQHWDSNSQCWTILKAVVCGAAVT